VAAGARGKYKKNEPVALSLRVIDVTVHPDLKHLIIGNFIFCMFICN
jgi:hypothetical protein